jgi:hypothetical protein
MPELSVATVAIGLEGIHIINCVVENLTSCNILNGLAIFTTYGAWEKQCDSIHYPIDQRAKVKVPKESEY